MQMMNSDPRSQLAAGGLAVGRTSCTRAVGASAKQPHSNPTGSALVLIKKMLRYFGDLPVAVGRQSLLWRPVVADPGQTSRSR